MGADDDNKGVERETQSTGEGGKRWSGRALEAVDGEIARYSAILGIRLLDPGVIERVVRGDATVYTRQNEDAFRKLRGLIGMHYNLALTNIEAVGGDEVAKLLGELRTRFRGRYDLGGQGPAKGNDPPT